MCAWGGATGAGRGAAKGAVCVPVGKTPLLVNLGATSLCLRQGDGVATAFVDATRGAPLQLVARAQRRYCSTHAAFVCDGADTHQALPQVAMVNE